MYWLTSLSSNANINTLTSNKHNTRWWCRSLKMLFSGKQIKEKTQRTKCSNSTNISSDILSETVRSKSVTQFKNGSEIFTDAFIWFIVHIFLFAVKLWNSLFIYCSIFILFFPQDSRSFFFLFLRFIYFPKVTSQTVLIFLHCQITIFCI